MEGLSVTVSLTSWNAGASTNSHWSPSFHGPRASISPWSPCPVESLKNWSTSPAVGAILPMEKRGLPMLSSAAANAFMLGDFARHQELQCVLGADIVAEIDQSFVYDLRAGFGG